MTARAIVGVLAAALVLAGCAGAAADHEKLGDRDYAERHFGDALVEYGLAIKQGATPRLRAKAGAAALHAGDLVAAAEQYRQLAGEGKGLGARQPWLGGLAARSRAARRPARRSRRPARSAATKA